MWRRIVLHLQHLRRILWSQWTFFVHLSGFWDGSSPWLQNLVWRETSCCADWTSDMCYFEIELQHIIACVPQSTVQEKRETELLSVKTIVGFDAFHKLFLQTQKLLFRSPRFVSSKLIFLVVRGEDFWSKHERRVSFPLWLDVLVWIVFNQEGVPSNSEVWIRC